MSEAHAMTSIVRRNDIRRRPRERMSAERGVRQSRSTEAELQKSFPFVHVNRRTGSLQCRGTEEGRAIPSVLLIEQTRGRDATLFRAMVNQK
jgi:hypothetical protein